MIESIRSIAFKEVGVDLGPLPSTSTETLKYLGKSVSSKNMKPGDVVFFDTYKKDGHVGIYVGDGKFMVVKQILVLLLLICLLVIGRKNLGGM